MKPIKYALLLLAALMAFSGTADAKIRRNSTSRIRREKERRAQKEREQRAKAIKAYKERQEKLAAARKKRIAAAEAIEREQREKANVLRQKKIQEEIAAAKAAKEEKAMLGEYDTMAREVRMSSAQRSKLVAMVRKFRGLPPGKTAHDSQGEIARLTKLHKSATGTKKKIIAARLKEIQLKKAKDKKTVSTGSAKTAKGSPADQHKQIMGLLTTPQKAKWGGYKLARDPALKFEGITLTEKQIKRIRVLCDIAAKALPDEAANIDPSVAAKTRKSVLRKLRTQIIYEVLTPAQRTAAQRTGV
ncbi:MAG: hypothetical protein QGH60_04425 [Phycisphaerae bacterium]|nr:hypothetical protein [Phycisphaerae bacterium]